MKSRSFFYLLACILIASLVLAACGGSPGGTSAPVTGAVDTTATLSEVTGTVQVRNPGEETFAAAQNGDRLQVQGQVSTGQDSTVRLDLSTGTIVRVAPESLFTLESNEASDGSLLTRLTLAAGRVWVVLRGGQLQVETPAGVASVRGSYLSVWVDPETDDVWVTCLEGWCQAENPTAMLDLVAGEGAQLYFWDPEGTTPPPPPKLRYLTQAEIDEFLANNPEANEVMNGIIATASALPTLAPAPESTPVSDCFALGLPENGATVAETGDIQFDWNDQPGAFKYIVRVLKPNGAEKTFLSWRSSIQIAAADLPFAGEYQWWVTAYNSDIQPLCTAGPWTFTKAGTPTDTPSGDCFQLTAPEDAAALPETGLINFTWTEQPGRYKYVITVTKPNGVDYSKIVYTNSYQTTAEALGLGGTYTWSVTAYDADIEPICTSGPRTFSLPGWIEPPTPEPNTCVTLLTPADGTDFPDPAKVDFTWTEYPGAYKYIISFKPPSTPVSTFIAWEPSHVRYVESFSEGGTYQWWVTPYDANIQPICTSAVFTFTKPTTAYPTATPKPDGGGTSTGLFWGQYVTENNCIISASVSTSYAYTTGTMYMKLLLSTDPNPDGSSPHVILGNLPGTNFSTSFPIWDIIGALPTGTTVYWRFSVYDNGTYILDGVTGSFTTQQACTP